MTPEERERFYDQEIASALAFLSKRCTERGLNFLAVVEWEPGEYGRTLGMSGNAGFGFRLVDLAARVNNNVDALIFALMKEARKDGHGSICLQQLGVPVKPAESVQL